MGVDIVEKNFKTINEQVEILKNKGLIIEDENVVKIPYSEKTISF